jgi:ATP-dependent RNA helicase DDX55/SPB4
LKENAEGTKKHLLLLTTDLSARGIDIPDVDWIVQFDPPQHSDSFVHRIGRTARAGREGSSLIFLTKPEESYKQFLEIKKVKL